MAAATIGCRNDALADLEQNQGKNGFTYELTAEVGKASGDAATRALTGKDGRITSAWVAGDQILAYNLSDNDESSESDYSLISALGEGRNSAFKGRIVSRSAIKTTDQLCFFYPGAATTGTGKTISATRRLTGDGKENPLVYHERQNTIKHLVELDLEEQDGTIATISRKFDFQWGKATPAQIDGDRITADFGVMQRKIAILALTFADRDGAALTQIDSVKISNIKSLDVFDLGTGEFVTDNPSDEMSTVVLKPQRGKFSSEGGRETYVALLPGTFNDVVVSAFANGNCYLKSYRRLNLEQDKVYKANPKMEQARQHPYVEVQGVRWATGNFIHYDDGENPEYWGIAPAQWWISGYAAGRGANGNAISSQLASDTYELESSDLDLFRYGDIDSALVVQGNKFKAGGVSIRKLFYERDASIYNSPTTKKDKAHYGDIVWYHTGGDNQRYRMPTKEEMRTLYRDANVIPAYCYTQYGNKIYGAYFSTSPAGAPRRKTFPTGRKKLHKYNDVTDLVRANKGLFLPVTGLRALAYGPNVTHRHMLGDAYGQYMTADSSTADLSVDLFFGPTEWNFSANGKAQSKAIRPVWDESSGGTPNPLNPAFANVK